MSGLAGIDTIYRKLPSPRCIRLLRIHGRARVSGMSDPIITISLDIVDLDKAPLFDALSYTWGTAVCEELGLFLLLPTRETQNILSCDGIIIPIRPNLHDALDMLLDTKDETRADFIWIDALCINQQDSEERASQVRLMDGLYSRASSVIVWLGPADLTTPDALSALDKLAFLGRDAIPLGYDDEQRAKASVSHIRTDDLLNQEVHTLKLGIEPITLHEWLSLIVFFSRPYFSRVWVIQEVTLARHILMICGRQQVGWESLIAASFCILYTGWQHFLSKESCMALVQNRREATVFGPFLSDDKACNRSVRMLSLAAVYQSFSMPLRLDFMDTPLFQNAPRERELLVLWSEIAWYAAYLLQDTRGSGASNPRDNVFALLGIVHAKSHLDNLIRENECRLVRLVDISYNDPINFIYTMITRNILRVQRNLRLLECRETSVERSFQNLPSWVPDFSVGQAPARLTVSAFSASSGLGKPPFPDTPQTYDGYFVLPVRGFCVGKIVDKDRTLRWESPGRRYNEICRVANDLPSSPELQQAKASRQASATSRAEVVARTCIANAFDGVTEIGEEVTELASEFIHHLAGCIAATVADYQEDIRRDSSWLFRAVDHTKLLMHKTNPFLKPRRHMWRLIEQEPAGSAFSAAALNKALSMFTDQPELQAATYNGPGPYGNYRGAANYVMRQRRVFRTDTGLLGVGPDDLKIGDEAWVLAGMDTPAILRRGKGMSTGSGEARCEFLGAAYVHGIMHGEAVPEDCVMTDLVLV
ncbi:heterokaryon incompatibility protein-domain-containing protein [Podospora aff. communis PSN243]|uniref:Heterokaryon incompatibility protein-domain-containing protein n=1 Tax=Podospora aff. communis PSN243 TaxID=3040156 RepID=A0AAV9GUZ6_9PEZI|nr:heterokaryon incompatibility protein-domain-containing protein [Podospora aff. communis PSN243]